MHTDLCVDKIPQTKGEIKVKSDRLEKYFEDFSEYNRQLMDSARQSLDETISDKAMSEEDVQRKDSELQAHSALYEQVDQMVIDIKVALYDYWEAIEGNSGSSRTVPAGAGPPPDCGSSSDMRLPPIKIKQFDGADEHWLEFRDMFEAMVHNRPNVESAVKLARLREVVDPVKVTQASGVYTGGYEAVWTEIKRRYDRPKRLVLAHVNRLMSMEDNPVVSRLGVRHVIDQFRNFIRAMEVLKQPTKEWDALIFPMIFRKMPEEAVAYYNRAVRDDEIPSVSDILQVIEDYAETVSCESGHGRGHHPSREQGTGQGNGNRNRRSSKTFVAQESSQVTVCELCGGNHTLAGCGKFKALDRSQRVELAREKGVCFLCLRPGHWTTRCKSAPCTNCRGNHHALMCLKGAASQQRVQTGGVQPQVLPKA